MARGFVRTCELIGVTMLVPLVWAMAVALGIWWGGATWVVAIFWAGFGTVALSRPVGRMIRALVAQWTGTVIPSGYRQATPTAQMSTGYWWNGFSYSRTS